MPRGNLAVQHRGGLIVRYWRSRKENSQRWSIHTSSTTPQSVPLILLVHYCSVLVPTSTFTCELCKGGGLQKQVEKEGEASPRFSSVPRAAASKDLLRILFTDLQYRRLVGRIHAGQSHPRIFCWAQQIKCGTPLLDPWDVIGQSNVASSHDLQVR